MLIDSELLTLNLMSYSGKRSLNLKIVADFFAYVDEEIKKRGLTFFEINSDLEDLGYMAKYLVKEEEQIKINPNIEENEIINYLKINYIDDEIEAIINNFVTKYSFSNQEFVNLNNSKQVAGELVLKREKIKKEM